MQACRPAEIAGHGVFHEERDLPTDEMARDAHHAVPADGENRQGIGVIATPDEESRSAATNNRADGLELPARFFDSYDVRHVAKADGRLGRQVRGGAAGDVVEHN